jgi:hypothetical protein
MCDLRHPFGIKLLSMAAIGTTLNYAILALSARIQELRTLRNPQSSEESVHYYNIASHSLHSIQPPELKLCTYVILNVVDMISREPQTWASLLAGSMEVLGETRSQAMEDSLLGSLYWLHLRLGTWISGIDGLDFFQVYYLSPYRILARSPTPDINL